MIENIIAYHCGPALAGIKPSNIVACYKDKLPDVHESISRLNLQLNHKDIYIEALCECEKRVLIMVYRRKKLSEQLSRNEISVPSQQKWTQKSFKKRNESQYFVNLLKSTALFHGLLAGDLCRHDVPAKERSSPRAIRPGTSLSYRLLIVKQLSRHKC